MCPITQEVEPGASDVKVIQLSREFEANLVYMKLTKTKQNEIKQKKKTKSFSDVMGQSLVSCDSPVKALCTHVR